MGSILSDIVVKCPWLPMLVLVPLCIAYDLYMFVRLRINGLWLSGARSSRRHDERVRHVQEQIREWIKMGRKAPMCTARPGERFTVQNA